MGAHVAGIRSNHLSSSDGAGPAGRPQGFSPAPGPVDMTMRLALAEAAPAVRRYLFGMCGDWDEAEDIAQEALLRAWARRESFDGRATAKTWIFTIARNHWLDRLRRRKTAPKAEPMMDYTVSASAGESPPAVVGRAELTRAIGLAMETLPSDQREALALRESEGLTFREIAGMLGVPLATAKSRVHYALVKLADELAPFRQELGS